MYLNLSILNYKNVQQKCQGQKTKSKTKQHQQIKKRNMEHSTFPSSFLFYYYYSILYFFSKLEPIITWNLVKRLDKERKRSLTDDL